ncbi:MAG: PAS domain S-box protein, partial [Candidatus Brocadiae bacterium]|nr:PAS domain S-box protein [Candidatus Brocadiia bacterium]
MPALICRFRPDGTLTFVNDAYCQYFGKERGELVGENFFQFIPEEDRPAVKAHYSSLTEDNSVVTYEHPVVAPDGSMRYQRWTDRLLCDEDDRPAELQSIGIDITDRKQAEEALRTSHSLLEMANRDTAVAPLLRECVAEVRRFTGCAAVGMRMLDEEGNIPYQAYEGFPREFYESENPLSINYHRCMCVNVIKGPVDPQESFYTKGGSFYLNGTTRFLAALSEQERAKTRNVCNAFGYESVALVPIRLGGRILGLIHVADPRENVLPLEKVQLLEKAAMALGPAIVRLQAEEALRDALAEVRRRHAEISALLDAARAVLESREFASAA